MFRPDTKEPRQHYKVLATKVSAEAAEMLEALAKKRGTTIYTMIQTMCRVFITLMCEGGPLSEELAKIIRLFESKQVWAKFNIADPTTRASISRAIYFMNDAKGVKRGTECVMVGLPFMNEAEQTFNIQTIIEAFFGECLPGFYRRLRNIGVELETNSIYETLDKVLDLQAVDPNEQELHRMFSDTRRNEFGREMADAPFVRHNKRNIETLPNLFEDER